MTTTAIRERPLLFSGPMVRAILEGRKTQTRRVVKPQPASPCVMAAEIAWMQGRPTCIWPAPYTLDDGSRPDHHAICPYGQPGDRLWVRETWATGSDARGNGYSYRADRGEWPSRHAGGPDWRPSIHMPRRVSRLTLEITGVRVERVGDISEPDAEAEGVEASGLGSARDHFCGLWNEINAARGYGWCVNPWVWVIEFRRLTKEGGASC